MTTEMNVTVAEFCSLPPECAPDGITSDGHVVAFYRAPEGGLRFLWDGVAGALFDGLAELRDGSQAVYSSEDGAHIAYVGIRGDKVFVGRDDREDPAFDGFSRSVPPTFDRAGHHLAYGAQVAEGEYRLIIDGAPVGTANLAPTAAVFSADGARSAYMEMRGASRGSTECRIVLDGQAGDWFAGTRNAPGAMQFSPDGRRFAYYAIDGQGHARWFLDGAGQRQFNEVATLSLARLRGVGVLEPPMLACFSPDSRRFAYFADVVEKGVAIVEDDVPGPLFKALRVPVFSPDSLHLAYAAETYSRSLVLVLDGIVIGEWPASSSGDPVFSPDGQRIALGLQREERRFLRKRQHYSVAVDGQMYPEELADDAAYYPVFSPDGSRVAWWVQRGTDTVLVVDGVIHGDAPFIASEPRFDALGRLVVASQVGLSQAVSVDDHAGPLADSVASLVPLSAVSHQPGGTAQVPFRLSRDGANVAWAGVFGEEMRPVFDDELGPPFDMIWDCGFANDDAAYWWAQRGTVVSRVERRPV